jgi:hypothetical protein
METTAGIHWIMICSIASFYFQVHVGSTNLNVFEVVSESLDQTGVREV